MRHSHPFSCPACCDLNSLFFYHYSEKSEWKFYGLQPTGLIRTGRAQQNETLRNSIFSKILEVFNLVN